MADQLTLEITRSFESVSSANQVAFHWLEERGTPSEIQFFANLVVEELATNCIKYGYDDPGQHSIEVTLSLSGNALCVTLVDDGRPFNPLEAPEPNFNVPLEERPIGGIGIHLVRKMSDRIDYVRESGRNKVTLHKAFPRPAKP